MQLSCHPQRRSNDLSLQHVALETLVYDERTHKAFCLNEVAAAVWDLLDGALSPAELSVAATRRLGFAVTEDAVLVALAQFEADGLLESAIAAEPVYLQAGMLSRRRLMGGMVAGAVVMVPVVAAVMTPRPAQAYNGCTDCSATQTSGQFAPPPAPAAPARSNSTPLFNDDVK